MRSTWSFEAEHAWARTVVERREKQARKDVRYSNSQIAARQRMREPLTVLEV